MGQNSRANRVQKAFYLTNRFCNSTTYLEAVACQGSTKPQSWNGKNSTRNGNKDEFNWPKDRATMSARLPMEQNTCSAFCQLMGRLVIHFLFGCDNKREEITQAFISFLLASERIVLKPSWVTGHVFQHWATVLKKLCKFKTRGK